MNLFLSMLLLFHPLSAPASNVWPGFRGAGDSHTDARGLPLKWAGDRNVAWNVALSGYGQSSPVVWRDKVFLTAVEGAMKEKLTVLCLDLKSGRRLWSVFRQAACRKLRRRPDRGFRSFHGKAD